MEETIDRLKAVDEERVSDVLPNSITPDEMDREKNKRSHEFTSENFKIEVLNLPVGVKYYIVRQLLERQFKLNPHKIRVGNKSAYLAFRSEEERDEAIDKIDNYRWKGRTLRAKIAAPRIDPFIEKTAKNSVVSEKAEEEHAPLTEDDIISQVCPYWGKSYEDQLKLKDDEMRSILKMSRKITRLSPTLEKDAPKLYAWARKNEKISCQFDGVIPSPLIIGYRNKCEFNIGSDGSVGFRSGRYRDASESVIPPPSTCPIINDVMFKILDTFQTYLKNIEVTKLKGYNPVTHEGHARQLTIRTNQNNQCLIIVDLHPQDLSEAELNHEIQSILKALITHKELVSVFFNISEQNRFVNVETSMRHVYGQRYLNEYLHINDPDEPLKFRVGPTSFFQVNTRATELLYKSIIELAQLDTKSLVLDVGCGTGTIGLSLARQVSYVIGIEVVKSAVDDAQVNAQENGISNATFFAGRAEDLIGETISILKNKMRDQNNEGNIIAIVDPPRTGFNSSFVKVVRASDIKKIIYIACDAKSNDNLIALCRPTSKAYQGAPFVPTRAKAFDLFPHTKFCELLLVYERLE